MSRFDYRSEEVFKKDIFFATNLEKYFFNKWMSVCKSRDYISVENPRDNGVNNDGEFIEKGATTGADYMVDIRYHTLNIKNMPLEIKWVPTHGKLTLKLGDINAYLREKSGILFIYSSKDTGLNLKKPKDYDLTKHIGVIESIENQLRWGIMCPDKIKKFLKHAEENSKIEKISYMGYKPGVILKQNEFQNWFKEENWT